MFGEFTPEASFTRIEEEVRRFWRRHEVPAASCAARNDGPAYVVTQQPVDVEGHSLSDQVRLLATADLLARYRAMRGYAVHHQAGWAAHGLPVELAVEQSVGPDTPAYDLDQFNAACRDVAVEGIQQAETLAARLGVWLDPESTYATLSPQAIGAVWSALHQLWAAGRLKREQRVVAVCPRCATPLSAAEAARRSVEVESHAAWVRLPWDGEPDAYFLVWTRTAWTLMGMVALATHPDTRYALVELPKRGERSPMRLLLAEAAVERARIGEYRLVRRIPGKSLRGARYRPPFTFVPAGRETNRLILSDLAAVQQGAGLLPITPAFDGPSLALAQAHDLPLPQLLDDWGSLADHVMPWRGLSPFDAEPLLIEDLRTRGLLHRAEAETRPRSLCPHCETPLLPLARSVWLVDTGSGPWIVGRDRAWGAPLPVWVCDKCTEQACVAGLDDLARRADLDADQIDPHRPAVDHLTFPCGACEGAMRRAAPVVDAAFEAAVLPWATAPRPGPANLAVGLGDQHIGWLGDLAETAALLRGSLAWEQSIALPQAEADVDSQPGHAVPADALRWAAYTGLTPEQAESEFLRPLWRLVVSGLTPKDHGRGDPTVAPAKSSNDALFDRWQKARLHQAIVAITKALDTSDPGSATGEVSALVRGLAYWHTSGFLENFTLLQVFGRLLAPFVPHLAEAIQRQAGSRSGESVHLADWPALDPSWADPALLAGMVQTQRLVALGQAARARAGIEPDRRLPEALLCSLGKELREEAGFGDLLADALAVARVEFAAEAATQVTWRLSLASPQAGDDETNAALARLTAEATAILIQQIREGLSIGLEVREQMVTLLPGEICAKPEALPGWSAAADTDYLVVVNVG